MQTTKFYRRILEFKDVLQSQITNSLVEATSNDNLDLSRDTAATVSKDLTRVIESGFDNMITSLQNLERTDAEAESATKKTTRRKKK